MVSDNRPGQPTKISPEITAAICASRCFVSVAIFSRSSLALDFARRSKPSTGTSPIRLRLV